MTKDNTKPLLSVTEVAQRLAVHRRTVYRLIEDGELSVVRIRRAFRVEEDALHAFINAHREWALTPDERTHRFLKGTE